MLKGSVRTALYARSWKAGADVLRDETVIERDGERVPATLVVPRRRKGPLPGWIALGGVSCMGRHHPQLTRFAGALASTGAAVLVPEVPEWRSLSPKPEPVAPTIRGCIDYLRASDEAADVPFGMIGFSFGAPQVAIAAGRGDLADHVGGIVLFGGYCSLERTLTCGLTGQHEWKGSVHTIDPDPFGGWVVGTNHLTGVPGLEDADDVAAALGQLARAASGQRISAWDPRHDPMIRDLRAQLPPARRPVFDMFARPSDEELPEVDAGRQIACLVAEAARRAHPLLDPADALGDVRLPTQLIHGHGDRLIPFTEGHRLIDRLPEEARRGLTVTRMLNHSADSAPAGVVERTRESWQMLAAIRGMINTA